MSESSTPHGSQGWPKTHICDQTGPKTRSERQKVQTEIEKQQRPKNQTDVQERESDKQELPKAGSEEMRTCPLKCWQTSIHWSCFEAEMIDNEHICYCSEEVKLEKEASDCSSEGCRNQKWHRPESCAANATVEVTGKLTSDFLPLNDILSTWSENKKAESFNLDSVIASKCTSNTQNMMASTANTLDDVTHARRPDYAMSETLDITSEMMTHMIKTEEVIPAYNGVNTVSARKVVSSASKNASSKTANTIDRETSGKMSASQKVDGSDQTKRKKLFRTCSHCRKSVRDLSRHIKTHSEERPHECLKCAKLFKYSYNLLAHDKVCRKNKKRQRFTLKSDHKDGTCTQISGCPVQLHDFSVATAHPGLEELARLWFGLATDVCDGDELEFIPVGYVVKMPSHLVNGPLNTEIDHLITKRPQTKVADKKKKKAHKKPPKHTENDQISTTNSKSRKTNTKMKSTSKRSAVRKYIYQCTQCTKVYKQKNHLERHERTHSAEKRHVCQNCERGFRERYQLWSHERGSAGLC